MDNPLLYAHNPLGSMHFRACSPFIVAVGDQVIYSARNGVLTFPLVTASPKKSRTHHGWILNCRIVLWPLTTLRPHKSCIIFRIYILIHSHSEHSLPYSLATVRIAYCHIWSVFITLFDKGFICFIDCAEGFDFMLVKCSAVHKRVDLPKNISFWLCLFHIVH